MLQQIKCLAEKALQVRMHRQREFGKCYYELPFGVDVYLDLKRLRQWSPGEVVFDVGANSGSTSLQLAHHFPDLQIYAFEPVKSTFQQLASRVGHLENVRCFNLAFGPAHGSAEMRLHRRSVRNTLRQDVNEPGYDSGQREVIKIRTVDDFLAENALDSIEFLKVDAEGYDLEVLKGAEQALRDNRIRLIQVEAGFAQDDGKFITVEAFRTFLLERGYLLFGVYQQANVHSRLRRCDAVFIRGQQLQ